MSALAIVRRERLYRAGDELPNGATLVRVWGPGKRPVLISTRGTAEETARLWDLGFEVWDRGSGWEDIPEVLT